MNRITRRTLVTTAVAASTFPRITHATDPIRIGMPLALTGPLGSVGQEMKNGAELWAKVENAKGGLLGRPIELHITDTGGDPATCVRKAQELVERDNCHVFFGMTLSSEALAVVPKLAEWNAIFVSSDNGDGRLTGSSLVPNFFRSNISGPMGTRAVSLYLRDAPFKGFYAIGMDYAWGRGSVAVFEDELKKAGRPLIGTVFSPTGTKDFATYISKIRQSGADALYMVLAGDDYNAFLAQAKQYRLGDKVQLLTEVVDLTSIRAVGDAAVGLIGSTRYTYTLDNPANKEFVALWQKEHGQVPNNNEGEQWQACQILAAGIKQAGGIETDKLRAALETVAIDSIKGHVAIRACDHQAVQQGYIVKVVKQEDPMPVPQVIATYSGDRTAPACNKMTYDD
ncbi:MAG TPA: ABC transporter substrate-binding protein [Acetobacteraceae bacterium]|jgi:branched-chain amino acid transport system substrate-binding protein|nr:ABC transporter substrate-binding protein [Acetobacteraceae bacterium]